MFPHDFFAATDLVAAFGHALQDANRANARRDWPAAEAAYARALRIDPLRADLWVQYGHMLKEQGRPAPAAYAYGRGAELAPHLPDASVELAHLLKAQGRTAEATAAFRSALAADPRRQDVRAELAALGVEGAAAMEYPVFVDADDLPLRTREGAMLPPAPCRPRQDRHHPSWRQVWRWRELARRGTPLLTRRRRTPIMFFHLQKTGGTSFDQVLAARIPSARICPIKDDNLHLYGRRDLNRFDLYSGHFDVMALRLVGRIVSTASVFRLPRARLVSFYRFHRGHDPKGRHGVNEFVRMAHAMSPEDFFEEERVRRAPEVFNHYLVVFGLTYHQLRIAGSVSARLVTPELVATAAARIRALDAIAILERFDATIPAACRALGLPAPRVLPLRHRTDDVAQAMIGKAPPSVAMTSRLTAALDELVRFDEVLYEVASRECERRLLASAVAPEKTLRS